VRSLARHLAYEGQDRGRAPRTGSVPRDGRVAGGFPQASAAVA
jgi:hypothetical protein